MPDVKIPTVKLKANIPVDISLKWCDYAKSQQADWPDKLRLTGMVNGEEGRVYVPLGLEAELLKHGIIQRAGETKDWDENVVPNYEVVNAEPFKLRKSERADGRKGFLYAVGDVTPPSDTAPTPKSAAPAAVNKQDRKAFVHIRNMYGACLLTAQQAWEEYMGRVPDDRTLQAATATLMVEARKQGLTVEAPPPATPPEPEAEEDAELPF
jgi:hypothetical protein